MHSVILSDLATRKLNELLDYLEDEWSLKTAVKFELLFENKLFLVCTNPDSCIESGIFKNLKKCVVTKQTSFLYRVKNNQIEVITVFDNRRNFKSIQKEIRKHYGKI